MILTLRLRMSRLFPGFEVERGEGREGWYGERERMGWELVSWSNDVVGVEDNFGGKRASKIF